MDLIFLGIFLLPPGAPPPTNTVRSNGLSLDVRAAVLVAGHPIGSTDYVRAALADHRLKTLSAGAAPSLPTRTGEGNIAGPGGPWNYYQIYERSNFDPYSSFKGETFLGFDEDSTRKLGLPRTFPGLPRRS